VYAREQGSIAAPTAGLHFTPELLGKIRAMGVAVAEVTLHVGRGTFRPVTADDASAHVMLPERYSVSGENAELIDGAKRVLSVGTTSTRTLETLARRPEGFGPGEGWSELFLYPGQDFKIVDALITNFHLPKSTPLLLASAFLGREKLLAAYREAFKERYRLYSYGDAMLIF
jgi:S-adenosylmethionine:tRNA ribosyltransferase-isomerase